MLLPATVLISCTDAGTLHASPPALQLPPTPESPHPCPQALAAHSHMTPPVSAPKVAVGMQPPLLLSSLLLLLLLLRRLLLLLLLL